MAEDEFQKQEQWRNEAKEFFLKFWRHWDAWIISVLGGSICLILVLRGILLGISERLMWIVIVLGIVLSAFKTWRDQKRNGENTQLIQANNIVALKSEIAELSEQLKEKSSQEVNLNMLGVLRTKLSNRRHEIENMGILKYKNTYPNVPFEVFDGDTQEIINNTSRLLTVRFTNAETALFESSTGYQNPPVTKSLGNSFALEEEKYRLVIARLQHFESQLDIIIKAHIGK